MQTVSLDLHDFSILRNKLDLLDTIKEHYPDFKVTLFTIPFDYEYELSSMKIMRETELKKIHERRDWMQFVPHGIAHTPQEFLACDKHTMKMILSELPQTFAQDGLPMEKGFCAPYWLWNQQVVDALDEAGWWGAVDRNQPQMLSTKRFYRYTYGIDERFWESPDDVLKLHGHMTPPSSNDLASCLPNLLKLPSDVKWVFASEFVEEKA